MSTLSKVLGSMAMAIAVTLAASVSTAAVPDGINYQAYLTDSSGAPIDTNVSVTFAAYTVDVGGVPLWSDTLTVSPDSGLFTVQLGNPVNPFPPNLFDTPVFIGLFVAGEELLPRRALRTAPYSFKAADADTLTGFTSTDLDQSSEVAALDSSVSGLQSDLTTTQGNLASLGNDVANNASAIGTNVSAIAASASDIATNSGRITTLEAVGGDITGVIAGAGLVGGAAAGNATVALAPGGVTDAFLATSSVTSTKIQNGAVNASKLNSLDSYTVDGLTTNGTTDINGSFSVNSADDIRIRDDFNGFRWFSGDGNTQFASITVRELDTTFRDNVRNQIIFRSEANGLAIGGIAPNPAYTVTLPDVAFAGGIDIGLERVTQSYQTTLMNGSCHSHGGLPCYYGSTSVTCPVGKRLVGGGASGSAGLFGSLSNSSPITDVSFSCSSSYDLANSTRFCYAICARID